jgi:shikimate 5-dehydrogenase
LRACGGTLGELPGLDCDIVVHATPVGTNDREATLVPHREFLRGKVVLDVVLSRDTRLLRDARAAGATVVTGRAVWAEQGRRQLERWLNLEIAAEELEVDP